MIHTNAGLSRGEKDDPASWDGQRRSPHRAPVIGPRTASQVLARSTRTVPGQDGRGSKDDRALCM